MFFVRSFWYKCNSSDFFGPVKTTPNLGCDSSDGLIHLFGLVLATAAVSLLGRVGGKGVGEDSMRFKEKVTSIGILDPAAMGREWVFLFFC